jgi:hypothetical protein
MNQFNQCNIDVELEFGPVDGKFMCVSGRCGDQIIELQPAENGLTPFVTTVSFVCQLPNKLELIFKGKDPNTGTIVGPDGSIVQDMYVKINKFAIDRLKCNDIFLHQKIKLITIDNQEIVTSYVGFNGSVVINLDQPNAFFQLHNFNQI